ncbi:TonB-dependent receptor [Haliangium sp.]|uniref:TonB-dependent receptor n=1 Tax=Haliangium sp. TaxID=2663208 RepID=UPI003D105BCE
MDALSPSHRRVGARVGQLVAARSGQLLAALLMVGLTAAVAAAAPLSGTVLDGLSLEPVADAEVMVLGTDLVAITDAAGRYGFDDVAPGTVTVRVTAAGYEAASERIALALAGTDSAVVLLFAPGSSGEVIEIESSAPPPPAAPGQQDLRREELTRIPGTRGDALTSLKSLPGVANADAAGSGPGLLVIRGAAPEDSKIAIDGIEIPILYHFFGLQSIVPSEFIEAIDYMPGGFGAEEGRATGGVINVTTRSDQIDGYTGFAELSFINFAGFVEGPISKRHNLQFSAGLRRSAIDLVLPLVIPEDSGIAFVTAPQYYDGQLRVDWRPSYRHRVSVLGLMSFDLLTLLNDIIDPNEPLASGRWENETSFTRVIATWKYSSDELENRLVGSVGTTGFRFDIADERYLRVDGTDIEVRDDALWNVNGHLRLRAGGELRVRTSDLDILFPLPPQEGSGGPGNFSSAPTLEVNEQIDSNTAALYTAADVRPLDGTTITAGLRLDHFDRIDEQTLSPRLTLRQELGQDWTVHAALGSYSRAPQQAEELQSNLMPELATQYVLGADYDILPGVSASMSGFYTDRRQLVVQDPVMADNDPENAYVNRGRGRSFGAEALIRAKLPGFFGWVAYTISRSDRVDEPLGERRLFDFDQTHNVIVVGSYTWGAWEFGGRWQYSTGSPVTPVVDSLYLSDLNIYVPVYGEVNSDRLDPSHQLDVRIDRTWRFDTWRISAYLDVTNVYANPRTLGFRYNFDFSRREAIEELPLVPALGVRGSF